MVTEKEKMNQTQEMENLQLELREIMASVERAEMKARILRTRVQRAVELAWQLAQENVRLKANAFSGDFPRSSDYVESPEQNEYDYRETFQREHGSAEE